MTAGAVATAVVLAGCSSTQEADRSGGQARDAELVTSTPAAAGGIDRISWALGSEPLSLDWVYSYDYPPNTVLSNVCESLLRIDESFEPSPGLAEEVANPDPTTWVYSIRPDVTFHDGSTLTAEDVAYSLNRHLDEEVGSYWSGFYSNVESVEATGPLEVTVRLTQPDVLFNQMMAVAGGVVGKKEFIEQAGQDHGTPDGGLMCTGPFELEDWSKGESITLTKFEDYWDPERAALADEIEFSFLSDAAALANALVSGAVDGTYGVPESALTKVQNSDAGDVYYGPQTSTRNLIVADLEGPLGDVRIRQALSLALDREGFADAAIPGPSEPSRAVASTLTWGEGEAGQIYADAWDALPAAEQDVERAKELVAEAGVPDEPIVVAQSPHPVQQVLANEVQAAGKRIGLDVEIKPIASEAYSALFSDPEARAGIDLFHTTWYADVAEPLQIYVNWQSDNFANYGGWSDAGYDALVDEALQESDPQARAEMVVDLQEKVTENLLWIPVDHSANSVFLSDRITGAPATNAYLYYPWAAQLGARG
ncbi:peptide/nickel transport system substrate-binding protein [Blastococcus sp. DSM 46786]|uniref:ABC transporter substrate-binding protein n=1 Tax=Blastococcus sp. DSM 46786 TaxID=1798227 RepID=UPI0008D569FD|nr:ABC transporter substrate-binding protein [Blastococcus sp. DSM 46786]SEL66323.1 peptide/nickel transport system substrate-binding protein [Blastococcus sp. DSM 46786]